MKYTIPKFELIRLLLRHRRIADNRSLSAMENKVHLSFDAYSRHLSYGIGDIVLSINKQRQYDNGYRESVHSHAVSLACRLRHEVYDAADSCTHHQALYIATFAALHMY